MLSVHRVQLNFLLCEGWWVKWRLFTSSTCISGLFSKAVAVITLKADCVYLTYCGQFFISTGTKEVFMQKYIHISSGQNGIIHIYFYSVITKSCVFEH